VAGIASGDHEALELGGRTLVFEGPSHRGGI
jgi:hypothetical protein